MSACLMERLGLINPVDRDPVGWPWLLNGKIERKRLLTRLILINTCVLAL